MLHSFHKYLIVSLLLVALSCEEPYEPDIDPSAQKILVVEGSLSDSTIIRLSWSTPLNSSGYQAETGALVEVEHKEDGIIARLAEPRPGSYYADIDLEPGAEYRLHITTEDMQLQSEWVEALSTPAIDELYYEVSGGELHIYLNSENDGPRGYYLWSYEETWIEDAQYRSTLRWDGQQVVPRRPEERIFRCYHTEASPEIILGSTVNLARNEIKRQPIRSIDPMGSMRLRNMYSIKVTQERISEEAFEFWRILEGNTEGMGSIFDQQPSNLPTNFTVLGGDAPVIGFFQAAQKTTHRIFIQRANLPFGFYYDPYQNCNLEMTPDPMFPRPLDVIFGNGNTVPVKPLTGMIGDYYTAASKLCVDCRVHGGTTTKPAFWP